MLCDEKNFFSLLYIDNIYILSIFINSTLFYFVNYKFDIANGRMI